MHRKIFILIIAHGDIIMKRLIFTCVTSNMIIAELCRDGTLELPEYFMSDDIFSQIFA